VFIEAAVLRFARLPIGDNGVQGSCSRELYLVGFSVCRTLSHKHGHRAAERGEADGKSASCTLFSAGPQNPLVHETQAAWVSRHVCFTVSPVFGEPPDAAHQEIDEQERHRREPIAMHATPSRTV